LSTKINATVDALGNPIGFALTPGQACDLDGADILLPQIEADIVIADKGFDADERVIDPLEKAGKTTVIPPKANRKHKRDYDKELYKARHLIENFFAKLKQFRAIATRYDKTALRANEDETWRCREFRLEGAEGNSPCTPTAAAR
jgi:transposase